VRLAEAAFAKAREDKESSKEKRRAEEGGDYMAEMDLLHLVQQRLGPDDYLYLAIARPRPRQGSARLVLPGVSPQAASSLPQAA
jgi:hypothetical protein